MQFIPLWPSYAIYWYRTGIVLVLVVIFAWGNQPITCTNVTCRLPQVIFRGNFTEISAINLFNNFKNYLSKHSDKSHGGLWVNLGKIVIKTLFSVQQGILFL